MGHRFPSSRDVFEGRDAPPADYCFKIQSFSSHSKASIEKYTSDKFEAGGYKWNLSIYPTGNKKRGGEGHISIGLALVDTSSLPLSWEVKAIFNLFVLDQLHDKYFCIRDGKARRFHAMKTKWEVPKFIELGVFRDAANGYLTNDECVFGAEIFVIKQIQKRECLSMMQEPVDGLCTWTVKPYSQIADRHDSDAFSVGDYKWRIRIYPRGTGVGKGNSLSVFLCLDESSLPHCTKLFVKFSFRLKDQNRINAEDFEFKGESQFGRSSSLAWGAHKFLSLAKLNDPKKGFLVNDTCVIKACVTLLGTVLSTPSRIK